MQLAIESFYDAPTSTLTYVVYDEVSRDAVLIDPVRDYEALGSKVSWEHAHKVAGFLDDKQLKLHVVLETHAHADHLSGAPFFKERYGAKVAIGARITEVQETFKGVFGLSADFPTDGSQFDRLLQDGEVLKAGTLAIQTLHTPGHTPACASYLIDDALFTGDALFMPDQGVGRCDFPRGSAEALWHSLAEKLYRLPDTTRVFVGHDYQPEGRPLAFESTIGAEKRQNVQLDAETSLAGFVEKRRARDAILAPPRLLFPSVQVNIDAGHLPRAEANGTSYLKIPLREVERG
jgi:glyoxylase-like metal-dependent hydrolase (beta-lactamase superfamily II)